VGRSVGTCGHATPSFALPIMLSAQTRPNTSAPGDGSRTITVHDVQPVPEATGDDPAEPSLPQGTLRLRGGPHGRPRVAWDEQVVDNENCGRKKSKSVLSYVVILKPAESVVVCCIYHKPKEFDESSSESPSSESDSDSSDGRTRARRSPNRHHHHRQRPTHPNGPSTSGGGDRLLSRDVDSVVHQIESPHEHNAYEVQPSHSKNGKDRMDGKHLELSSTISCSHIHHLKVEI
jgi:protein phosphatase 1 regulatory subunit 11